MATKHHPNLVRLLGYATCGDLRERIEQILVYEFISNGDLDKWLSADAPSPLTFGILMLVVLTGKPATYEDDKNHSRGILKWVQEKVGQGSLEEIADPRMGTVPPDALQRIADLAMRCTATFTADRPSMGRIAQEMDALRGEVGGGEEQVHKAYEVVDAELRARMQQQQKMSEQSMDSFLDSIHSGKIGSMMDTGEVITVEMEQAKAGTIVNREQAGIIRLCWMAALHSTHHHARCTDMRADGRKGKRRGEGGKQLSVVRSPRLYTQQQQPSVPSSPARLSTLHRSTPSACTTQSAKYPFPHARTLACHSISFVAGRGVGSTPTLPHAPPLWPCREEAPEGGLLRREAAGGASAALSSPARHQLSISSGAVQVTLSGAGPLSGAGSPSGAGSLGVCGVWRGGALGSTPTLPHAPPLWPCRDSWGREGGSTAAWQSHCSKGEYRDGLGLSRSAGKPPRCVPPLDLWLVAEAAPVAPSALTCHPTPPHPCTPLTFLPLAAYSLLFSSLLSVEGRGVGVNTAAPSRSSPVAVQVAVGGEGGSTPLGWGGKGEYRAGSSETRLSVGALEQARRVEFTLSLTSSSLPFPFPPSSTLPGPQRSPSLP
ncbi:unnamed protein product [Closterium sp. NIES-65]|nr:unnamed protein product [Closterium sp. NIES-65]